MNSDRDTLAGGLPHSEIPGSPIARISPGLFAACHVLHRLSVPRHPPDALASRLITTSPHRRCQPPPRTGPSPMPAPATAGAGGLYEDTSLGPARSKPCLPGRSASVTSQLSLHPSINPPRRLAVVSRDLLRTSPNAPRRCLGRPRRWRHPRKACTPPEARRTVVCC